MKATQVTDRGGTYLRTWVTANSMTSSWYPGHEVQVDLKICESVDISRDRDWP